MTARVIIFPTADRETVSGDLPHSREEIRVRSHGSLHERSIPVYALGAGPLAQRPRNNAALASRVVAQR